MMKKIRITIAQVNLTVGDLEGNFEKIVSCIRRAEKAGSDIIAFPELAITGYPPEDLILKSKFVDDNLTITDRLATMVDETIAVVGFIDKDGSGLYNAAAVMHKGEVRGIYRKILLPNYGVFDERRYFLPGSAAKVFKAGEVTFGVNICEDIWHRHGPIKTQSAHGAEVIINISSSPYHAGKTKEREELIRNQARAHRVGIVYVNLIGGQDELVFDGQSMAVASDGRVLERAGAFKEDILTFDLALEKKRPSAPDEAETVAAHIPKKKRSALTHRVARPLDMVKEVYEALTLGIKDYVSKNGFKKVVIGLSGGIDSALVTTLAHDALGAENVIAVYMPSRYSSHESERDARALAAKLRIKFLTIPIDHIFKVYLLALEKEFAGRERDIAEENLQARIRGNILMALSNKFGWLVLTTGNKSEMSTGYATLYGDMAGGFAAIKDIPKMLVYKLAHYRNRASKVITESVITKAPTAELRHQQKDSDTLPPYDTLDAILKAYVEDDKDANEIAALGFDRPTVERVLAMVDRTEYKRRQAPPGTKITTLAFGKDRRMPITNRYKS